MEEPTIEVRYAGTVVAKSAPARDQDANGFFLSVGEPMPVGTVLQLTVDQVTKYGRVEQVVESTESMQAGMRIRFVAAPAARPAPVAVAPAPVVAAAPPSAPAAAPVVEEVAAPVLPVSIADSAATATSGAGDDDAGGNGADANSGQGGGGRRRRRRR